MKSIHFKYGIGIAATMIVYFLVLKVFGFHQYPILSGANGLIIGAGLFYALVEGKRKVTSFDYGEGFKLGLFTGGLASIVFVIFMSIYIYHIDDQFARSILDSWHLTYDNGALILLFSLFVMSCATTVVLTLAFMQLLKESRNQS